MISVGAFFGTFVVQLPVFAVLVLGLILLGTQGRRLPPRSLLLARAGLAVMLAEALASMTWTALLPQFFAEFGYDGGFIHTYGVATAIVGFVLSVLFALGVGLLIAAVLAFLPAPHPAGPVPPGPVPPGPVPPGPVPHGPIPPGPIPPGSVAPGDH